MRLHHTAFVALLMAPVLITAQGNLGTYEDRIAVEDVISGKLFACKPEDDIHTALKTMQENKIRRLPVVGADGTLEGILSMNDIVLKAEEPKEKKASELSYADVVKTYKSICQHRLPMQAQAAGSV